VRRRTWLWSKASSSILSSTTSQTYTRGRLVVSLCFSIYLFCRIFVYLVCRFGSVLFRLEFACFQLLPSFLIA
jgi:hypothetical protein